MRESACKGSFGCSGCLPFVGRKAALFAERRMWILSGKEMDRTTCCLLGFGKQLNPFCAHFSISEAGKLNTVLHADSGPRILDKTWGFLSMTCTDRETALMERAKDALPGRLCLRPRLHIFLRGFCFRHWIWIDINIFNHILACISIGLKMFLFVKEKYWHHRSR